jgi:hypothetical protein
MGAANGPSETIFNFIEFLEIPVLAAKVLDRFPRFRSIQAARAQDHAPLRGRKFRAGADAIHIVLECHRDD